MTVLRLVREARVKNEDSGFGSQMALSMTVGEDMVYVALSTVLTLFYLRDVVPLRRQSGFQKRPDFCWIAVDVSLSMVPGESI